MPSGSKKRDLIAELKAYAGRSDTALEKGFPDWERLTQIIKTYLQIEELGSDAILRGELQRHVVVSLAAVAQSAVRRAVTEVVDQKDGELIDELDRVVTEIEQDAIDFSKEDLST